MKRGQAWFALKNFASALDAFSRATEEPSAETWKRKCRAELDANSTASSVAQSETKAKDASHAVDHAQANPTTATGNNNAATNTPNTTTTTSTAPAAAANGEGGHKSDIVSTVRHAWYQNAEQVVIDVFLRNAPADAIHIDCDGRSLRLAVSGAQVLLIPELFGPVVPGPPAHRAAQPKIEITLRKADMRQWARLDAAPAAAAAPAVPEYPTSSKVKKDWTQIDKAIEKDLSQEKPSGEDALNHLLKGIYSNASEETRRAMNKSYLESGGTVLSTNWSEVGSKEVKGTAPKGMEMRDWKTDKLVADEKNIYK